MSPYVDYNVLSAFVPRKEILKSGLLKLPCCLSLLCSLLKLLNGFHKTSYARVSLEVTPAPYFLADARICNATATFVTYLRGMK